MVHSLIDATRNQIQLAEASVMGPRTTTSRRTLSLTMLRRRQTAGSLAKACSPR